MYKLTLEGQEYLKNGLPEKQLLKFLLEKEKPLEEVVKLPKSGIAIGWAKKNNWITIENNIVKLTEAGKKAANEKTFLENALEEVNSKGGAGQELVKVLMSRNLAEEAKVVEIPRGGKKLSLWQRILNIFSKKQAEEKKPIEIAQLTPELLKTGEWKNQAFRKYDVNAPAPKIYAGKKQPYIQFIEEIREKLVGLGFEEMKGPLVETYFWNDDALFMPQDHPARGIHDVLLLSNPSKGSLPDENLISKVKATHEGGWILDSFGWGGTWSRDEAAKLIMRSQTTAVSARTLFNNKDTPAKYFCIDRNFRPDIIDAKHLMEFDHCEGIVIGENLNFSHLLGFLKEMAKAVGAEEIKFKPSYFPFTEPSVEMYAKFPKFGWVEVAGAGLMRPEVLKPLGVEKSQVLAWALGIGRLAMLKLGAEDIRMLYSDDLEWLRNEPLVK